MPLGPEAPRPKYVVCNGDEMEPGSFKDRYLLERNPHLLVEGMTLAAYAVQADAGYVFLRAQYDHPRACLERALEEARAAGYLGAGILASSFSFDIYVHESTGRYICGEASAMLNALEGQRPNPRARPPHMTGAGLYARPTVVNNVETLCAVPAIVRNGAAWWKGVGASEEGGTKIFGVAGRVARPGCIELPTGTPMRELLEVHAGGMLPGYELRAVSPGGASTSFVAAADIDVPLDFSALGAVGSRLGTGTMVVLDDQTCPVGMTLNLVQFFAQESCGWCTPCREGLQWAAALLAGIEEGRAQPGDLGILDEAVWFMGSDKCFCDLAPGATQPLESALRLFRKDFERHVREGRCGYPSRGSRVPAMRGTTW
jgi:NADH-quinone oxidoreductase subunit F